MAERYDQLLKVKKDSQDFWQETDPYLKLADALSIMVLAGRSLHLRLGTPDQIEIDPNWFLDPLVHRSAAFNVDRIEALALELPDKLREAVLTVVYEFARYLGEGLTLVNIGRNFGDTFDESCKLLQRAIGRAIDRCEPTISNLATHCMALWRIKTPDEVPTPDARLITREQAAKIAGIEPKSLSNRMTEARSAGNEVPSVISGKKAFALVQMMEYLKRDFPHRFDEQGKPLSNGHG